MLENAGGREAEERADGATYGRAGDETGEAEGKGQRRIPPFGQVKGGLSPFPFSSPDTIGGLLLFTSTQCFPDIIIGLMHVQF